MKAASEEFLKAIKSSYWQREDAQIVVRAWRSSGESLAGFGRRWSLSPRRISRWARRLEESESQDAPTFYPVQVKPPAVEHDELSWVGEVRRRDWTVRVPAGFAASEMARLLAVIAEVESC